MVENISILGYKFGVRPSSIFEELFDTQFKKDESILVDLRAMDLISELEQESVEETKSTKKDLERKFQAEDARIRRQTKKVKRR